MSDAEAVCAAIQAAGGRGLLAHLLEVSDQTVYCWATGRRPLPRYRRRLLANLARQQHWPRELVGTLEALPPPKPLKPLKVAHANGSTS